MHDVEADNFQQKAKTCVILAMMCRCLSEKRNCICLSCMRSLAQACPPTASAVLSRNPAPAWYKPIHRGLAGEEGKGSNLCMSLPH